MFGVIILFHELGHFLAAKAFGVYVHEFAIGFGPPLASFRRGETRYSLRLFLILGGFVRMAGEETETDDPRGFNNKPVWQRMIVIFAGPAMNFILAMALLAVILGWHGQPVLSSYISEVIPGSPAAAAGFQPGDHVVAIDGRPVRYFNELADLVQASGGQLLAFTVERQGQQVVLRVAPRPEEGTYRIGIVPDPSRTEYLRYSWGAAIREGAATTWRVSVAILQAIGEMITGRQAPQLSGPVGIVQYVAEASREGLDILALLAAHLSINIGLFNLFPIPALDGSRLMFLSLEFLRGRRLNPERENMVHFVGLMLLLGLMAVLTYKEVLALF